MSTQPTFWLQVRKDYVLENFESLVTYLRNYNYDAEHGSPDYDSTLDCMVQLCDEIRESLLNAPFNEMPEVASIFNDNRALPCEPVMAVRLVAATLLACKAAGRSLYTLILTMARILLKLKVSVDSERLYRIIVSCLQYKRVHSVGVSWDNISPRGDSEFNINFLALAFCRAQFGEAAYGDTTYYLEHEGLMLLPPAGAMELSVVNREEYQRHRTSAQFRLADFITISHKSGEIEAVDSFADMAAVGRRLLSDSRKMKASAAIIKRQYSYEDMFPVCVTKKNGSLIVARSIDSRYLPIDGKVLVDFEVRLDRPSPTRLKDMIKEGDFLMVSLSDEEGYAFDTKFAFEEYYREQVATLADETVDAIGYGIYPKGLKWISREGVRICVEKGKIAELDVDDAEIIAEHHDIHIPVALHLYKEPPKLDAEIFNVYAAPAEDFSYQWSGEPEFFSVEDADRTLFAGYLERANAEAAEIPMEIKFKESDPVEVSTLIHLFYRMASENSSNTRGRFLFLLAAAMLARICDFGHWSDYLCAEMEYLASLADFASNANPEFISVPEGLKGNAAFYTRKKILEALISYRRPAPTHGISRIDTKFDEYSEEEVLKRVEALVSASNNLVEIVDIGELDNIKRMIARLIGMGDEYESIIDSRTFYGCENVALEFKSSVVFPPAPLRRDPAIAADPDTQKWVILRTVCGFLNSRSGGDLLIGVNDAGYASGLADDINTLYRKGLISQPNIDQYTNYIQNMLDTAFRIRGGKGYDKDVARANIEVSFETNSDDREIVRVHIKPFRRGIVEFSDFSQRPSWVSAAYARQNARTTPLSDAIAASLTDD